MLLASHLHQPVRSRHSISYSPGRLATAERGNTILTVALSGTVGHEADS